MRTKRCNCKVSQYIPRGYGYKEIRMNCGSTGVNGQQLLCDKCRDKAYEEYPQGWKDVPGDVCEHGNYVGNNGGPDYLCGECEDSAPKFSGN